MSRLLGHTDYVRSSAASPVASEASDARARTLPSPRGCARLRRPAARRAQLWATGSYDHTVQLWDVRQQAAVLKLPHGAQVESVCFLPGGGLLATAGGQTVCIWDILAGGCACARARERKAPSRA